MYLYFFLQKITCSSYYQDWWNPIITCSSWCFKYVTRQ